jgi:hypothetical protein
LTKKAIRDPNQTFSASAGFLQDPGRKEISNAYSATGILNVCTLCPLMFQFAKKNWDSIIFNTESGLDGYDWLLSFLESLESNAEISVR